MADVFTAAHFSSGPGDAVGNGPTFISTLAHVDGGAGAFYGITAAPTTEHGCFVDDRSPDRTVPWCRQICGHLCAIHPRGSVAVLFLAEPNSAVVGASGAVYGLFATLWMIGRRLGADTRGITVLIIINFAFS